MEPRQGGRFHIWHMLGRGKCLFATNAHAKDGTFAAKTASLRRPTACGRDAARLRAPRLHFARYLPAKADEFDNNVSYMLGQIEQCIIV